MQLGKLMVNPAYEESMREGARSCSEQLGVRNAGANHPSFAESLSKHHFALWIAIGIFAVGGAVVLRRR